MTYEGILSVYITNNTLPPSFTFNHTLETTLEKYPSHNEIRAGLILKGVRLIDIAKDLKVSRVALTRVVSGDMASDRIRQEIARRIGKPISTLWPVRRRRGSHI